MLLIDDMEVTYFRRRSKAPEDLRRWKHHVFVVEMEESGGVFEVMVLRPTRRRFRFIMASMLLLL